MDLAGVDLPLRQKRTYATAAAGGATTDEGVEYPPTSASDEADRRIYSAIHHASTGGRRDFVTSLINHYRSPRDSPSPHPELDSHLPRPEGYTVGTYNVCMSSLLSVRNEGESIAPLLEIYNEMLERDILPNGRTYVFVIRALCLREKDVQSAVAQHETMEKWSTFKSKSLGTSTKKHHSSASEIEGYLAEGNIESAYNLFIGIKNVQTASSPDGFYRFLPPVYSYLLDALATQVHPSTSAVQQAREIFNHAHETETSSRRSLYKHMFRLLGNAKDSAGLNEMWDKFEAERVEGQGTKLREWKDVLPGSEVEEREVQVEGFQRDVWVAAIKAFISVGQVEKGMELVAKMEEREDPNPNSTKLRSPPRLPLQPELYGTLAVTLAQAGEFDLAHRLFGKAGKSVRPVNMGRYLDALVLGGKGQLALNTYLPVLANMPEGVRPDNVRIKRLYSSVLASARQTNDAGVLSPIEPLLASGNHLLDTDLAVAHIRFLISQKEYGGIAGVLNNFGPLQMRHEQDNRQRLSKVLEEVGATPIELSDMLDTINAFARQRTHVILEQQELVGRIVDKYMSARSADSVSTLSPEQWSALFSTMARTVGIKLNEGEYDAALEALVADLKEYSPNTLKEDTEGRITNSLAERLFNRFGSEKAIEMLTPLLASSTEAAELIETFQNPTPTTPELEASSSSSPSISDAPLTPPLSSSPSFRIDEALSRRLDSHQHRPDHKPSITPQRAYTDLRSALSSSPPSAPAPESLGRLMISLSREGDQSRVLELYSLAQSILPSLSSRRQESAWRQIEDSMLISQCHLGNLETAGLHRHRLVERGMAPSADAYATMISSSKDTTDDAQVARELWEESQRMGVVAHLYLYNTVISKLSKARKAEVALEMFAQMKERGVRPSSVTYGAVIVSCHISCLLVTLEY
jgi:pentatricopeptide repeat protein